MITAFGIPVLQTGIKLKTALAFGLYRAYRLYSFFPASRGLSGREINESRGERPLPASDEFSVA